MTEQDKSPAPRAKKQLQTQRRDASYCSVRIEPQRLKDHQVTQSFYVFVDLRVLCVFVVQDLNSGEFKSSGFLSGRSVGDRQPLYGAVPGLPSNRSTPFSSLRLSVSAFAAAFLQIEITPPRGYGYVYVDYVWNQELAKRDIRDIP
jgi:hypothetical protein